MDTDDVYCLQVGNLIEFLVIIWITIKIWDMKIGICLNTLTGNTYVYCMKFVNDSVVSGYWDDTIKIWDMKLELV